MLDRARDKIVEVVEALGSVDERGDRTRLLGVHAGRDVDQHDGADEVRVRVGEREGGHTAERHANDGARLRRERGDRGGDVVRVRAHVEAAVRAGVRVSVSGKVDRDERTTQRERNSVPGVGVLAAAVEEDQLSRSFAPDQAAEMATVAAVDTPARHRRWTVVWDAELRRVLVEHRHLVVRHPLSHGLDLTASEGELGRPAYGAFCFRPAGRKATAAK